jgi:sulfite reductase (NADPH) flavoprotein alpha-component
MLSETKLNVLKQISGDLSRDEAIWASGYLAGLAGGTPLPQHCHLSILKLPFRML